MSDTRKTTPIARKVEVGGKVVQTTFELYILAEILYLYFHGGEQTLHGALVEWWSDLRERWHDRAATYSAVESTYREVRDLPETDA